MANNHFRGDAPAIAQVNTVTPASVTIGNIFTLTCNGKTINFTATANTVANVTAGLVALVNASLIAEFGEVTAVDNSTALTLTAKTPGMSFTITSSAATGAGSAGCTLVTTATTASSGPNDISTLANWTTGALPTGSDDIHFDVAGTNAYWGLQILAAVAPNSINVDPAFNGAIGLPDVNSNGYYEYRQKNFQTLATSCTLNSQSGFIRLDFGSTTSVTVNVFATGNPTNGAPQAVRLVGVGSGSTLNILQGTVGYGINGDSCTFATINTGDLNNPASDANLYVGYGASAWTTLLQNGGTVYSEVSGTTWTMPTVGTGTLAKSATLTTLNGKSTGTLNWLSNGTIGTGNLGPKFTLDASQNPQAKTMTNCTAQAGATILDPAGKIIFTNPIQLGPGAGIEDMNFTLGKGRTLAYV